MFGKRKALNTNPRREDLTDRECCSILGGLLGSLTLNASIEDVRNAVRWWAEQDEAWASMAAQKKLIDEAGPSAKI